MHCHVTPTSDPSDINGCWVSQTTPTGNAFLIDNNTLIVDGKSVATLTRIEGNRFATLVEGQIGKEVAEVMDGIIRWANQDVWIPGPFGACATTTKSTTHFRTTPVTSKTTTTATMTATTSTSTSTTSTTSTTPTPTPTPATPTPLAQTTPTATTTTETARATAAPPTLSSTTATAATTNPHLMLRTTAAAGTTAATTTAATTTTTFSSTFLAAVGTIVPPVLVRQWEGGDSGSGGSFSSLSWLLALLLVCCCLAWVVAGGVAACAFFKPMKYERMVQNHNYEMSGMHAKKLQPQMDDHLNTPVSRSSSMFTRQEYDRPNASPEGYHLRPDVAPLTPPPAPLSSVMALQPQYVLEGRMLRPSKSMTPVEPLAAQASRPMVHQASSALQSSTSFVCPAEITRPTVHQAGSALESSNSFSSQAAEVSLPVQVQPVTAQPPQVVRASAFQFIEPQATPRASQTIPTPALRPQLTVPWAAHAPPQLPEPEFDLVTLTSKGYEVRHFDKP